MKKFHLLVLLIFTVMFSAACEETDTSVGGDVVVGNILAVAEKEGIDEIIKVGGLAGAVPPGSEVIVTNQDTGEEKSTVGLPDGSFDPDFQASTDDTFLVEVFEEGELIDMIQPRLVLLRDLIDQDLALLGNVPANLIIRGNRAYIVNAFSNNIQVFDIDQTPPTELGIIVLPQGSGPGGMDFINQDQAIIANNTGQTAAIVNLLTFECETLYTRQVVPDFEPCNEAVNLGTGRFEDPSGVLVEGNTAYITNNNLEGFATPNGNGFITIINLDNDSSFTIQAGGANSGDMLLVGEELFILNGGNISFNFECDPFLPPSLDIMNINTNVIVDNIQIPLSDTNTNVCLPGTMTATPDNEFAYIGLGLVGALLKVDLVNKELVRGADNPIIVAPNLIDLNFTSDIAIDENGIGYTTLFNTDQIAVFNTANDEVNPFPAFTPFPAGFKALRPDSNFLDGVQLIAIRQGSDFTGPNIYYATTLNSQQLNSLNTKSFLE